MCPYRLKGFLLTSVVLLGLAALAACASPSSAPTTSGATVTLQNIAFDPQTLTIQPGETVIFVNADQVEHHIVVGTDDLGVQQPGTTKKWTPAKEGVYVMRCVIHPSMKGTIKVGSGGSTVGTSPAGSGPATGGGGSGGTRGY